MPTFQYEALNQAGKPQKGEVEAQTSEEAIARIKSQGFFPTSVREKKVRKQGATPAPAAARGRRKKGFNLAFGGVSQKLLTQFTQQLSTLQDAGLPILRSLQILAEQQKPGKFKGIIEEISSDVEGGSMLSEAMAKHPKAFNRLYTKMVAAGEVGGVLDVILKRLAVFMEKAQKLKRKIIGAMIYPAVVISVAILIITGIMIMVIPRFQEIFRDFGAVLPLPTQMLIDFSAWMAGTREGQHYPGAAVVVGSPAIIWALLKLIRKSEIGLRITDRISLRIPVLGRLLQATAIARFTRTLGTLIAAGVPILEAITITSETVGNKVYEIALKKVHDAIREGEAFAVPLRQTKVVDSLVVNMVDVGEETGELDTMLIKVADNYDDMVDTAVAALMSILEPVLVVFLGTAVGTIVICLFMPMVSLIQAVSK